MAATAAKSKRAKGGAARSTSAKRRATASKRAAKSAPRRATGKAAVAAVRDVAGRWEGATDCAGLVTFHELAERLTRIELELDVVPTGLGEAAALALRLADRRAEADLRRFKARVEAIDPDDYPPIEDEPE